MKLLFLCLPLLFLAASSPAEAATCTDLKTCAKVMYDLFGQRYIWDAANEKQIVVSPDLDLTKENAEIVFTALLDQAQLARVAVGDGKTFRIVPGALRKEMEMPITEASFDQRPKVSDTWDWYEMRYRVRSREETETIESMYRLHLPREARMQADYNGGFLLIDGPAPLIRRMYEVIRAADVPLTAAVKKHIKEQEKKWEARRTQGEMVPPQFPGRPLVPPGNAPPPAKK